MSPSTPSPQLSALPPCQRLSLQHEPPPSLPLYRVHPKQLVKQVEVALGPFLWGQSLLPHQCAHPYSHSLSHQCLFYHSPLPSPHSSLHLWCSRLSCTNEERLAICHLCLGVSKSNPVRLLSKICNSGISALEVWIIAFVVTSLVVLDLLINFSMPFFLISPVGRVTVHPS